MIVQPNQSQKHIQQQKRSYWRRIVIDFGAKGVIVPVAAALITTKCMTCVLAVLGKPPDRLLCSLLEVDFVNDRTRLCFPNALWRELARIFVQDYRSHSLFHVVELETYARFVIVQSFPSSFVLFFCFHRQCLPDRRLLTCFPFFLPSPFSVQGFGPAGPVAHSFAACWMRKYGVNGLYSLMQSLAMSGVTLSGTVHGVIGKNKIGYNGEGENAVRFRWLTWIFPSTLNTETKNSVLLFFFFVFSPLSPSFFFLLPPPPPLLFSSLSRRSSGLILYRSASETTYRSSRRHASFAAEMFFVLSNDATSVSNFKALSNIE